MIVNNNFYVNVGKVVKRQEAPVIKSLIMPEREALTKS